jgi:hypothetical protein
VAGPVEGEFRERSLGVEARNPTIPYAVTLARDLLGHGHFPRSRANGDTIADVIVAVAEDSEPSSYSTSRFVEGLLAR